MKGTECNGESCCTTIAVPGGKFMMGVADGAPDACPSGVSCGGERPAHETTVGAFSMDKYEVTVGRFRVFVEQYDSWSKPKAGDGAHPNIAGSGWRAKWNDYLPKNKTEFMAELAPASGPHTWSDKPAGHEQAGINYVNWFEALAFCIWDGGTLPTEAEWEYVASGGEERLYPWGSAAPDAAHANYKDTDNDRFLSVGSKPAGAGKWGHMDLAGGMREWVLDWADWGWYSDEHNDPKPCNNCANIRPDETEPRIARGGSWYQDAEELRAAARGHWSPDSGSKKTGFRCVRFK